MNQLLWLMLGVGLLGIGWWGRVRAPDLVPSWMEPYERALRVRRLRRNATLYLVFAAIFVAVAVVATAIRA
ncbi:hypothetical protein [Sciscionella marina]|uniref:hypothetical protein n=1 Tax=Sciscionella marina TaxID=508770 RepID=UPI00036969EC|nr:hypothetical protein [Sciscionella marina]